MVFRLVLLCWCCLVEMLWSWIVLVVVGDLVGRLDVMDVVWVGNWLVLVVIVLLLYFWLVVLLVVGLVWCWLMWCDVGCCCCCIVVVNVLISFVWGVCVIVSYVFCVRLGGLGNCGCVGYLDVVECFCVWGRMVLCRFVLYMVVVVVLFIWLSWVGLFVLLCWIVFWLCLCGGCWSLVLLLFVGMWLGSVLLVVLVCSCFRLLVCWFVVYFVVVFGGFLYWFWFVVFVWVLFGSWLGNCGWYWWDFGGVCFVVVGVC